MRFIVRFCDPGLLCDVSRPVGEAIIAALNHDLDLMKLLIGLIVQRPVVPEALSKYYDIPMPPQQYPGAISLLAVL